MPESSFEADLELLGERAMEFVRPGTIVGLGSGRASEAFVQVLGRRVKQGLSVTCVSTSEGVTRLATSVGLKVVELSDAEIDVTIDGADEIDPDLNALKGFGGALVRERIVAAASRRQILLVRSDKLVPALGQRSRLPVEVVPFAVPFCSRKLRELGFPPEVRQQDGRTFVTDNGNITLDCAITPLRDPRATAQAIRSIPGVVDLGLFIGTAERVLVGEAGVVRELKRKGS